MSLLDDFIDAGSAAADAVMGTGTISLTLSNGGGSQDITGVWSLVSVTTQAEDGGPLLMADASVVCRKAQSAGKGLIGAYGSFQGETIRVINVDIGEALDTVYFENAADIFGE